MFVNPPKGKTPEELYKWALELCEKINREINTEIIKKEDKNGI